MENRVAWNLFQEMYHSQSPQFIKLIFSVISFTCRRRSHSSPQQSYALFPPEVEFFATYVGANLFDTRKYSSTIDSQCVPRLLLLVNTANQINGCQTA